MSYDNSFKRYIRYIWYKLFWFCEYLRQYSGLSIPESNICRGGTRFWYNYFSVDTKLNKFDP